MNQVFNGMRISTDGRFANGSLIGGGLSFGRTWKNNCAIVDSPQQELYCDSGPPLSKTIQFKLYGTYRLAWDIETSATFRVLEGPSSMPIFRTRTRRSHRRSAGTWLPAGVWWAPLVRHG